jgi:hypothetical protein
MIPAGTKAPNWNAANWTVDKLGTVFGITLDKNTQPNIYVSSTQIYNGASPYNRIVWRLDGFSGAHTKVFDFGNAARSLGNVKYVMIGTTENIYVSDWQTGKLQRLTGNSATALLWANPSSFTPAFPGAIINPPNSVNMPYGIAVRKIGGVYRLYYSRISTNNNSYGIGGYGNNEIYSVALNGAGDFVLGSETKENIPSINSAATSWGGYGLTAYCPNSAGITSQILPVISDIAFTDDGKRMLVGQQSWGPGFGQLAPHNSGVYEFLETSSLSHNWSSSASLFPSGDCASNKNCVGGVTYSNSILKKDNNSFSCDTAVWFTSDCIYVGGSFPNPSPAVYGIQGMKSSGGTTANSIWIDADDDLGYYDKNDLGDVEAYKKPLECNPCSCGRWETAPTLNGVPIAGAPIDIGLTPTSTQNKLIGLPAGTSPVGPVPVILNYPIQFVQGNVSGLINATYLCNGNCGATYSWTLVNNATTAVVASGTTLPVDLATYNGQLKCGKYTLTIKAKCGDSNCDNLVIPITIICEPPSCCKAVIDIDLQSSTVTTATNIPNPNAYSTANLSYNLNFSLPMSEIRVSVEDFKFIINKPNNTPNCLNCNNRPVTWGNILSAAFNGNPMTLSGLIGPPSGSVPADYREAVYAPGTPIPPPSGNLNIQLSLPSVTGISCCDVSVYICLKFTFKDTQCRECVQMVCGEIKLTDTKGDNTGNPKDKMQQFDVKH